MRLTTSNVSNMKHILPTILFLALGSACGGGEEDDSGSGGTSGNGGSTAAGTGGCAGSASGSGGTSSAGTSGTAGKGGSAGTSGSGGSSGGKGGSGGSSMPEGGMGGGGDEPRVGVCGLRSAGVVTVDDFATYEEFFLLGEEGFGEEVCVVRVDVVRVGDAPPGCDEMAGQQDECLWTHQVEYQNPEVLVDEDGACANGGLELDAPAIAALAGKQMAYGYVFEYQGHNSVLMTYSEERSAWEPGVNAGWTESTGEFQFDRRDGACNY